MDNQERGKDKVDENRMERVITRGGRKRRKECRSAGHISFNGENVFNSVLSTDYSDQYLIQRDLVSELFFSCHEVISESFSLYLGTRDGDDETSQGSAIFLEPETRFGRARGLINESILPNE